MKRCVKRSLPYCSMKRFNSFQGLAVADGLEHRKPHAAAVDQPGAKQGFGGLFQEGDQLAVVAGVRPARPPGSDQPSLAATRLRTIARQPILNIWSNSVIAPGPDGVVGLHLLDRGDQLHGFLQEAQPRQIGQQAAEHGLQAPRGDDPLRMAAAGQGHVQQGLLAEGRDQPPPDLPHALRVAAQHGLQRRFGRLFPGFLAFAPGCGGP